MRFINYSNRPLTAIPAFRQDGSDSRWSKPIGLWFSVVDENGTDSWRSLCTFKGIDLIQQPHVTEIIFKKDARLFRLFGENDIDALDAKHRFSPGYPEWLKENPDYTRSGIRWNLVAEEYDGVIAAPHCIARHLEQHWYFTWECASGCIWNSIAVESLSGLESQSEVITGAQT